MFFSLQFLILAIKMKFSSDYCEDGFAIITVFRVTHCHSAHVIVLVI